MVKPTPQPGDKFVPWPGLARLWSEGSLAGLIWALALTSVLHFAVLSTFVWTRWVPYPVVLAAWSGVAVIWLLAWTNGWMGCTHSTDKNLGSDPRTDLFRRAQREYLRGNWFQAETALEHLLATKRMDVPARLMLATLYRHVGRVDEAKRHLLDLEELPGSDRWQLEVRRERELLDRRRKTDSQLAGSQSVKRESQRSKAEVRRTKTESTTTSTGPSSRDTHEAA